jgi:hypothetical protein
MTPQKSAGCLTDPPVSLPRLAIHRPALTAAAEPPEEPPGTLVSSTGFRTLPCAEFSLEDPMANSSQFRLPMMIASSRRSLSTAVALMIEVTFVANDIFDTDHDTKKPARRMALAFFEIKLAGSFFCFFGENLYECIEVGFFPNAGKVVIHYGGASNGPVLNFRMKLCYGTMNVQTGGTFWFFDLQGRK